VVQGCDRPQRAELVTVPAVQRALEQMRAGFDQVLVDLPANFTEQTLAAIDAADRACLVTAPTIPGLRATAHCLEVLEQIRYPASKVALVLNRARPGGLGLDQVSPFLRRAPEIVVMYSEALEDCAARGVPVIQAQPAGAAAGEVRALADFVAGAKVAA
jgi:pilus assembly protein CpaE